MRIIAVIIATAAAAVIFVIIEISLRIRELLTTGVFLFPRGALRVFLSVTKRSRIIRRGAWRI
jgi:hypothetical protein